MISFRLFHSHLTALSNNDLNGTCIKGGFERAFVALFDQDIQTFTYSMLLNLDQLEKQLDKEEFQETGSIDAFRALMICKSFLAHTRTEIRQFHDTLIQHMESVKKSIDERAQHKRDYDSRVNDRQMQSKEGKVDSRKQLDAGLAITESIINSVNVKQPMAEVQLSAEHNILANEKQHSEQSESVYDTYLLKKVDRNTIPKSTDMSHKGGEIHQNVDAKKCQVSCPLLDPSFDNITTKFSNHFLEFENISLKKTVAQLQKDFSRMETHYVNMELKYQNQVLKNGKTVENADLKAQIQDKRNRFYNNSESSQLLDNRMRFERPNFSKPRFASQVDVNNVLLKPVTQHYLPKGRESAFAKPKHMIASSSSRNSSKNMPRFSSNDMVHNHYLEEAQKKIQEKDRNSKSSVMHSTRLQNTTNDHKPKPRSNNQTSRSLPISKSSCVTLKIPTGKIFTSSTTKVDSEPPNGSNKDITNPYECGQTLNISAGTLNLSAGTPFNPKKERLRVWLLKKLMSKNQVPQGIHKQEQSLNNAQCVKEQQQRAYFDDPCHELINKVYISQGSSSNVHK
ncbi:hypothetical protein Tco_1377117 [Tanacetum coccineum]